jgi:hypothetical protein
VPAPSKVTSNIFLMAGSCCECSIISEVDHFTQTLDIPPAAPAACVLLVLDGRFPRLGDARYGRQDQQHAPHMPPLQTRLPPAVPAAAASCLTVPLCWPPT